MASLGNSRLGNRQSLHLYRELLRHGKQYNGYNIREYIKRRVRDEFKQNKLVSNSADLEKLHQKARDNLDVIKRQVAISKLYNKERLIIE